jgi:hypothetical protein
VRSKGAPGGPFHGSRRTLVVAAVVGVLVVVGVVLGVVLSSRGGSGKTSGVDFAQIQGLQTGAPPWNNGVARLPDNVSVVHLDTLTAEGTVLHIHAHLDVYVNGNHVAVPADIGIDDNTFLTELHTHDASGVIHIESPTQRQFVLGQFFGEWAVRLSASCLGRYCGDLHWWVDGTPQTGNPADLVLRAHQEIVIAVGRPPAHIPSKYAFPAGE